jgi:hypothetical protein
MIDTTKAHPLVVDRETWQAARNSLLGPREIRDSSPRRCCSLTQTFAHDRSSKLHARGSERTSHLP